MAFAVGTGGGTASLKVKKRVGTKTVERFTPRTGRATTTVPVFKTFTREPTIPKLSKEQVRKKILRQANRRRRKQGMQPLGRKDVFKGGKVRPDAPGRVRRGGKKGGLGTAPAPRGGAGGSGQIGRAHV